MGVCKLGTLRHGLAERNLGAVDGAGDAVLAGYAISCAMITSSAGLARRAQTSSAQLCSYRRAQENR